MTSEFDLRWQRIQTLYEKTRNSKESPSPVDFLSSSNASSMTPLLEFHLKNVPSQKNEAFYLNDDICDGEFCSPLPFANLKGKNFLQNNLQDLKISRRIPLLVSLSKKYSEHSHRDVFEAFFDTIHPLRWKNLNFAYLELFLQFFLRPHLKNKGFF